MSQKPEPDVIFFLGAGASVKAGVPDTYKLVTAFQDEVKSNPSLGPATERIVTLLKGWKKTTNQPDNRVDVELLLEALDRLRSRESDFLLRFYDDPKYLLEGEPEKSAIIERLRDFIKSRAIVDQESVSYLQPILMFVREYSPLDIFTVNYDTSVEQFSVLHKLDLSDGFESRWDSSSFDRSKDMRLYKLHGSITWYKTDHNDYVKVPILARVDEIELVTKERARSLILYPMHKWDYDEPLLELLMILKRRLETAKYCIMVGYSFRDEHITRIFWDAARTNRDLHIIFIGPHSREIYEDKLQYYPDSGRTKIPSSLSDRVVCLPYKFEDVFGEVHELLRSLNNGLLMDKDAKAREMYRGKPDWMSVLKAFTDAEHFYRTRELQTRVDWDSLPPGAWPDRLQYSFKLWLLSYSRRESRLSELWASRFQKAISDFDTNRLRTIGDNNVVALAFAVSPGIQVGSKQLLDAISPIANLSVVRVKMLEESLSKVLARSASALADIVDYLSSWGDGNIGVRNYIQMRGPLDGANTEKFSKAIAALMGNESVPENPIKTLQEASTAMETGIWQDLIIKLRSSVAGYS